MLIALAIGTCRLAVAGWLTARPTTQQWPISYYSRIHIARLRTAPAVQHAVHHVIMSHRLQYSWRNAGAPSTCRQ